MTFHANGPGAPYASLVFRAILRIQAYHASPQFHLVCEDTGHAASNLVEEEKQGTKKWRLNWRASQRIAKLFELGLDAA